MVPYQSDDAGGMHVDDSQTVTNLEHPCINANIC
jgi:hypothetical protein